MTSINSVAKNLTGKALITGANGFVGNFLASELSHHGMTVVKVFRSERSLSKDQPSNDPLVKQKIQQYVVGDIDKNTYWSEALTDVDVVIHLAARVHVMNETAEDPLVKFRLVNTEGSLNLARQAVESGVKRFIYLSTIKVNGEKTSKTPFYADDPVNPQDSYAISKFEAEQQLLALGKETGLEVVIIRPPLVYGVGVKGNFKRLINLVSHNIPLPLAGIKNVRSLVNLHNLCSFIEVCLFHPKAVGEVFLVSDGEDLSTSKLLDNITTALGKKNRLFYLPQSSVKIVSYVLRRGSEFERLFGSLQVNIKKNEQLLAWKPETSVMRGIKHAVE